MGKEPIDYKIGIGDVLTFSRLVDSNHSFSTHNKVATKVSPGKYKLGVGDTLTLTLIKVDKNTNPLPLGNSSELNQNVIISSQQKDFTINSTGRIGSDGSVLLLEVGRLEASGKSLNELRSEVRNILIRNGISPQFQLEISDFKSQNI